LRIAGCKNGAAAPCASGFLPHSDGYGAANPPPQGIPTPFFALRDSSPTPRPAPFFAFFVNPQQVGEVLKKAAG